jgi:hypothetical protein
MRMQGKVPTGDVILNPNWKRDYVKMFNDFIKKVNNL